MGTRTLGISANIAVLGDGLHIGGPDETPPFSPTSPEGTLRVATATGTTLTTTLTYDFPSEDFAAAGDSLDLAFNGVVWGVVPGAVSNSMAPFTVQLLLTDGNSQTGSHTLVVPSFAATAAPVISVTPLTEFTSDNPLLDLTDIEQVQVHLNDASNPGEGADFTLSGIAVTSVPEPTSLLVWGLLGGAGVGCFGFARRKRKA
ncbi:MAG: hypothetical protein ACFCD0_24590 [Gemmataceae bacterium]